MADSTGLKHRETLERSDTVKTAATTKPARPRLNTISAPGDSNPWRIASSYHLNDDPVIMQPLSPNNDYEMQESSFYDQKQASSGVDEGFPKFEEVRHRRMSVKELFEEPVPEEIERVATLRRKSTAKSIKGDHIICWKGPEDPERPTNWPRGKKWSSTVLVSLFTFMAPMTSSMIAPCLTPMAQDLGATSHFEADLMLSLFILAFAFGPLLFGMTREHYWESIVYADTFKDHCLRYMVESQYFKAQTRSTSSSILLVASHKPPGR
jgi:hypothetical protein